MIGLCRGEPPLGPLRSSPHHHIGRGSLSSEPWNKCGRFCKNKRIIKLHSVFKAILGIFLLGGHRSKYFNCINKKYSRFSCTFFSGAGEET